MASPETEKFKQDAIQKALSSRTDTDKSVLGGLAAPGEAWKLIQLMSVLRSLCFKWGADLKAQDRRPSPGAPVRRLIRRGSRERLLSL